MAYSNVSSAGQNRFDEKAAEAAHRPTAVTRTSPSSGGANFEGTGRTLSGRRVYNSPTTSSPSSRPSNNFQGVGRTLGGETVIASAPQSSSQPDFSPSSRPWINSNGPGVTFNGVITSDPAPQSSSAGSGEGSSDNGNKA